MVTGRRPVGLAVAALDAMLADGLEPGTTGLVLRVAGGIVLGLLVFGLFASRLCRREWAEVSRLWTRSSG